MLEDMGIGRFERFNFSSGAKVGPTVVKTIIKLNVAVFVLWFLVPGAMGRHFLVSWDSLEDGRYWTLLTSVFSHNALFHIFINMYVLFGFGNALEGFLGKRKFVGFYLLAGIMGSALHAVTSAFLLGQPGLPALGASGAIAGVIMLFSLLFPKEKILLLGFIPLPAIWGSLLFVAIDLWGLSSQAQGSGLLIGHGAHLGGTVTGLGFYFLNRRRFH